MQIEHLWDVVNALANEQKLDEKYHDHRLVGNYNGFWECHIEPDWHLVSNANIPRKIIMIS